MRMTPLASQNNINMVFLLPGIQRAFFGHGALGGNQTDDCCFVSCSQVFNQVSSPEIMDCRNSSGLGEAHNLSKLDSQTSFLVAFWVSVNSVGINFGAHRFKCSSFLTIWTTTPILRPVWEQISLKLIFPLSLSKSLTFWILSSVVLEHGRPGRFLSAVSSCPFKNRLCHALICVLHIVFCCQTALRCLQHSIGENPVFAKNFKVARCSFLSWTLAKLARKSTIANRNFNILNATHFTPSPWQTRKHWAIGVKRSRSNAWYSLDHCLKVRRNICSPRNPNLTFLKETDRKISHRIGQIESIPRTHTHTHTHTNTHTHTRNHKHTTTHTQTHKHKNTHTHTHTHVHQKGRRV